MRKLPEMLAVVVFFAVGIQVGIGAIQPYLGWIGRTVAIVVCVALIGAVSFGVVLAVRLLGNRSHDDDIWND